MSNLKVNSKTKILEFKAKHNKLVDEMPSTADITSIANSAIEEDKNIYDKITVEYDSDNDKTIFKIPNNYMILTKISVGINYPAITGYFAHENYLVNSDGVAISGSSFSQGSDYFEVKISGEHTDYVIQTLEYIKNIKKQNKAFVNSLNLYYPSAGTKLYKHIMCLSQNSQFPSNSTYVVVVSSVSSKYSFNDLFTIVTSGVTSSSAEKIVSIIPDKYNGNLCILSGQTITGTNHIYARKIAFDDNGIDTNVKTDYTYFFETDTVTPL